MSSPSPFPGAKASDRPRLPRTRAATWSHRETLDFLALWGEERIQAQLNRCHRNADVYQWISERMAARGYSRDEDQCRTKGKDLKKSYKQAKGQLQDGAARQRCRFFHELDAILGGGGGPDPRGGGRGGSSGRKSSRSLTPAAAAAAAIAAHPAPPWCQVVIKEEDDPELDPDPDPDLHQGGDGYAAGWTQASVTDGSDMDPQGEPSSSSSSGTPAAAATAASSSSSSSSSQVARGSLRPEEPLLPPHPPQHPSSSSSSCHAVGGIVKEEGSPDLEEAAFDARGDTPAGDPLGCGGVEEPLRRRRREPRGHLDAAAWRPARLNRRAFSRPRSLQSTREKLAQLRNRKKRPRDDRFDELIRDIRVHFREREKLFQGLWEEEKAQREKDRRLWAAEMDWIREMWAKSQKEKEAAAAAMGEDTETNGLPRVKEESWHRDLSQDVEGEPLADPYAQEPLLLKVAYAKGNPLGPARFPPGLLPPDVLARSSHQPQTAW